MDPLCAGALKATCGTASWRCATCGNCAGARQLVRLKLRLRRYWQRQLHPGNQLISVRFFSAVCNYMCVAQYGRSQISVLRYVVDTPSVAHVREKFLRQERHKILEGDVGNTRWWQ